MDAISGFDRGVNFALQSLSVHSVGMQVTAHNIANVSTDGFLPQRATFVTGSGGAGVALETVRKQPSTGLPDNARIADYPHSGTELAKEIPHMIATQRGFEANAATIRAMEEMGGYILDIKA